MVFLIITVFHSFFVWSLVEGLIGPPLPLAGEKFIRLLIVLVFSGLLAVVFNIFHPKREKWVTFPFLILGLHGIGIIFISKTHLFPGNLSLSQKGFYNILIFSIIAIAAWFWGKDIWMNLKKAVITTLIFFISYTAIYWHGQFGAFGHSLPHLSEVSQTTCPGEDCIEDFRLSQGEFLFGWVDSYNMLGIKLTHTNDDNYALFLRYVKNRPKDGVNYILLDERLRIQAGEAEKILEQVGISGFWELKQVDVNSRGLHGYTLTFLGKNKQSLHYLGCWMPTISWQSQNEKEAKLRLLKLAVIFLQIADLKIPKRALFTGLH